MATLAWAMSGHGRLQNHGTPMVRRPRPRVKKTPCQKDEEAVEEDAKKTRYICLLEGDPAEEDSIFTPAESPHFQNAADTKCFSFDSGPSRAV
jgi:hypothetical protein